MKKFKIEKNFLLIWLFSFIPLSYAENITFLCPSVINVSQKPIQNVEDGFDINPTDSLHSFQGISIGLRSKLDKKKGYSGLIFDNEFIRDDESLSSVSGNINTLFYVVYTSEDMEQKYVFCAYKDTSVYLSHPIPKELSFCKLTREEKNGKAKDVKVVCSDSKQ